MRIAGSIKREKLDIRNLLSPVLSEFYENFEAAGLNAKDVEYVFERFFIAEEM